MDLNKEDHMRSTLRLTIFVAVFCSLVGSKVATAQLLPPPHANLDYLGYYYHDSKFGDYTAITNPYTNLSITGPGGHAFSEDPDWEEPFEAALLRAAGDGKRIFLFMDRGTSGAQVFTWDAVLDIAAPFWASIDVVMIFDDNITATISQQDLEGAIIQLRAEFTERSLADRPIMANFPLDDTTGLAVNSGVFDAAGLDIVAINAYIQMKATTADAVAFLETALVGALALIDTAGKNAFLVMQGYDRNGGFTSIPMLEALQEPIYIAAANDTNVIGIAIFSYARAGGTLDHPELILHHKRISWAMGIGPRPPGYRPKVDLNGDGLGDVLTYDAATGAWKQQVSLSTGGFSLQSQGTWATGWSVYPGRFDGDQVTDFFLFNTTSGAWAKVINNGTGFTTQSTGSWWAGWQIFVMDLDFDEVSDLFLHDPATGNWFKSISTSGGFTYAQGGWSAGWEVYPLRLNTDLLGDMFLYNSTTGVWYWVVSQLGSGFEYPVSGSWATGWQIYPGDFSGDGRTDLLLHAPSTGGYFVVTTGLSSFSYVQGTWSTGYTPKVADLDADGKDDIFLHDASTGTWAKLINSGSGTFSNVGSQTWSTGWSLYPTDVNGDDRFDIVLYDPTTGVWYQARNLVNSTFSYSNGTWATGLTLFARTPVR